MAGVLIHDVSGYPGAEYNLKIPSLTDTANIQEAMMLFHYGIDNYDGTGEPAAASVFGNLRDFDERIAELEASEIVALAGTVNQITASGSVGAVTVSLPSTIVTPGSLTTTTTLSVGGSASFTGQVSMANNLFVTNSADIDLNLIVGSGSANYLNVSGSGSFTEKVNILKGVNVFANSTERDNRIASPTQGVVVYQSDTNQQLVYNGSSWVGIENNGTLGSKIDNVEVLALLGL
jgi:hypothetical protein